MPETSTMFSGRIEPNQNEVQTITERGFVNVRHDNRNLLTHQYIYRDIAICKFIPGSSEPQCVDQGTVISAAAVPTYLPPVLTTAVPLQPIAHVSQTAVSLEPIASLVAHIASSTSSSTMFESSSSVSTIPETSTFTSTASLATFTPAAKLHTSNSKSSTLILVIVPLVIVLALGSCVVTLWTCLRNKRHKKEREQQGRDTSLPLDSSIAADSFTLKNLMPKSSFSSSRSKPLHGRTDTVFTSRLGTRGANISTHRDTSFSFDGAQSVRSWKLADQRAKVESQTHVNAVNDLNFPSIGNQDDGISERGMREIKGIYNLYRTSTHGSSESGISSDEDRQKNWWVGSSSIYGMQPTS